MSVCVSECVNVCLCVCACEKVRRRMFDGIERWALIRSMFKPSSSSSSSMHNLKVCKKEVKRERSSKILYQLFDV